MNVRDKMEGCFTEAREVACPTELLAYCHPCVTLARVSFACWVDTAPRQDIAHGVQAGLQLPLSLFPSVFVQVHTCTQWPEAGLLNSSSVMPSCLWSFGNSPACAGFLHWTTDLWLGDEL